MSLNHSKPEKNELQYRKASGGGRSGGSGQQRSFIPGRSRGGGGSTAPPLSDPSLSTCRSYKKTRNAQGVQSRLGLQMHPSPKPLLLHRMALMHNRHCMLQLPHQSRMIHLPMEAADQFQELLLNCPP